MAASEPFLRARLQGAAGTLWVDAAVLLRARWTVLFGPSGAGKSTVSHGLCGLTRLPTQQIVCDAIDLSSTAPQARRFALVTQRPSLFPHLSAEDNVLFSLNARADLARVERKVEAERLLHLFQADVHANKYPHALSGGEQQRVALARAVASRPRLLLLDEALSGLERGLARELIRTLREWTVTSDTAVLSVTHDIAEAMECADEVLRMEGGRVIEQGAPLTVLAAERAALLKQIS